MGKAAFRIACLLLLTEAHEGEMHRGTHPLREAWIVTFDPTYGGRKPCRPFFKVQSSSRSFLVPLMGGGLYRITPEGNIIIYKWYISGIYCHLGDYKLHTTYLGNQKQPLKLPVPGANKTT